MTLHRLTNRRPCESERMGSRSGRGSCPSPLDGIGGDAAGQLEEVFGRRVAVRLRHGEAPLPYRISRFTCELQQNEEPTSELEPLSCSLRVTIHALLGVAGACRGVPTPHIKLISFLSLAL
jgi:hypothetical protein